MWDEGINYYELTHDPVTYLQLGILSKMDNSLYNSSDTKQMKKNGFSSIFGYIFEARHAFFSWTFSIKHGRKIKIKTA